jgi:hypothetical protein
MRSPSVTLAHAVTSRCPVGAGQAWVAVTAYEVGRVLRDMGPCLSRPSLSPSLAVAFNSTVGRVLRDDPRQHF